MHSLELVTPEQTFGYLTTVSGPLYRNNKWGRQPYWQCLCKCGISVCVRQANLLNGHTQSCGCYRTERTIETLVRHGESKRIGMPSSPEWRAWVAMRSRCTKPSSRYYKHYGGRGIIVCERWQSFENFLADMGRKPSVSHSIERCDVNGNYAPDNCVWATVEVQAQNKRNSVLLTFRGETLCAAEWSRRTKIKYELLLRRKRDGWDDARCFKEFAALGETVGA
jgi:hypothetical protein